MSKNMFYIKEEDQELFDQFSPIFIDYGKNYYAMWFYLNDDNKVIRISFWREHSCE